MCACACVYVCVQVEEEERVVRGEREGRREVGEEEVVELWQVVEREPTELAEGQWRDPSCQTNQWTGRYFYFYARFHHTCFLCCSLILAVRMNRPLPTALLLQCLLRVGSCAYFGGT